MKIFGIHVLTTEGLNARLTGEYERGKMENADEQAAYVDSVQRVMEGMHRLCNRLTVEIQTYREIATAAYLRIRDKGYAADPLKQALKIDLDHVPTIDIDKVHEKVNAK